MRPQLDKAAALTRFTVGQGEVWYDSAAVPLTVLRRSEVPDNMAWIHTYWCMTPVMATSDTDPAFRGTPGVVVEPPETEGGDPGFDLVLRPRTSHYSHYHDTLTSTKSEIVQNGSQYRDLGEHTAVRAHYLSVGRAHNYTGPDQNRPRSGSDPLGWSRYLALMEPVVESADDWRDRVRAIATSYAAVKAYTWGCYTDITQFDPESAVSESAEVRPTTENDTWTYYGSQCGAWNCASGDTDAAVDRRRFRDSGSDSVTEHDFDGDAPSATAVWHGITTWDVDPDIPRIYAWSRASATYAGWRVWEDEE